MKSNEIFEYLINKTEKYLIDNDIKCMVLGVSGGIDSTVCAAICKEVSLRSNIPLYGRSLNIKNSTMYKDEYNTSQMVGEAFCDDFKTINLSHLYCSFLKTILNAEDSADTSETDMHSIEKLLSGTQTPIANGNIQARLRMMYLYNIAGTKRGIVIDTDNLTEHYLGFYTIHGDQGDFNIIGGLWKSEVYELAEYMYNYYLSLSNDMSDEQMSNMYKNMANAIKSSINLEPTDGLGITTSDVSQIGVQSYKAIDDILQQVIYNVSTINCSDIINTLNCKYGARVVYNVLERYEKSHFKRKKLPIKIDTKDLPYGTFESSFR